MNKDPLYVNNDMHVRDDGQWINNSGMCVVKSTYSDDTNLTIFGFEFKPEKDITSYELALIWKMTTIISFNHFYDEGSIKDYLEKHNLIRHFIKE